MQYHKAALKRSCYTKYFPVIKIDMIFLQSLLFPNIMTGNSKTSKNEKKKIEIRETNKNKCRNSIVAIDEKKEDDELQLGPKESTRISQSKISKLNSGNNKNKVHPTHNINLNNRQKIICFKRKETNFEQLGHTFNIISLVMTTIYCFSFETRSVIMDLPNKGAANLDAILICGMISFGLSLVRI